jgi:uncharacterized protein (TIGR02001 family)
VPAPRFHTLSVIFTVAPLLLAAPATAQLGVSVSADSDYRLRGVSLSDGKPDLSLNVSYDHSSGLYGGASLIGVEGLHGGVRLLGYVDYIGYAARFDKTNAWDFGVTNSNYREELTRPYNYSYTEIYAGFIRDDFNAHVYYSPNYLGEGVSTVYLDVNGTVRPAPQWRLFGHVGALTPVSGWAGPDSRREHYDLRAGVAAEFRGGELRLAWTTTSPDLDYPLGHRQGRAALVLGAALFF